MNRCLGCAGEIPDGAAFCPQCGHPAPGAAGAVAVAPPSPPPPPPPPPTPPGVSRVPRQDGIRGDLIEARRWLPLQSPLLGGIIAIAVAIVIGLITGDRPGWVFLIAVAAVAAAVAVLQLAAAGRLRLDTGTLPAQSALLLELALLLLTTAVAVQLVRLTLAGTIWVVALALVLWGEWPVLRDAAGDRLDPVAPLRGTRGLIAAGVVVLVVGMAIGWGRTPQGTYLSFPGTFCGEFQCPAVLNVYGAFPYDGRSVEFADWVVLLLVVAFAATTVGGRIRGVRLRLVPAAVLAVVTLWMLVIPFSSVFAHGGTKSWGWWLSIIGLITADAGAVLLLRGRDDGPWGTEAVFGRIGWVRQQYAQHPPLRD